ncbi:hypothetical protein RCL_jg22951.t1 [Rhizophagus clarus]|uniref:Uncharacterized protein n=1 Tax=Rhizophagus clarus TaxID=94130 RepID=A0A8H3L4U6_9GLOM|nr:hypothetical protein RCL_jg22951.t1 [Rhizophagus clarus]
MNAKAIMEKNKFQLFKELSSETKAMDKTELQNTDATPMDQVKKIKPLPKVNEIEITDEELKCFCITREEWVKEYK